jgi:ATP-dependent Lon protease
MKNLSRELLTIVRISSLLPRSSPGISPILARRLELYISKKDFQEAGILADFMTNIVDATFEERLRVLSALAIKDRLERVIDILARQVNGIKGNVKITTIMSTNVPSQGLDITQLPTEQREALIRRGRQGSGLPPGFGGFGGMGGGRGGDDAEEAEPNELDELKQKLDDAKLSPEAQKVADKEMKRLKKMNPAQA